MMFLNVPYAEKDEARALGARWNPARKRWYVPDGVAHDAFRKWMPNEGEAAAGVPAAGVPAAGAPAPGAQSGRRDSAVAKLAVGSHYRALAHDCNPFEPCAECTQALAGSGWLEARAALAATLAGLKR